MRFKLLDAALMKHQFQADALLEVLRTAQELFGFLQNELLMYIARRLKLPPSRVYGVATFYHLFTFKPHAAHTCNLCMGTACFVKGAASVQHALQKALRIAPGQTRPDGKASLSIVRCIGTCGLAPLAVLDNVVVGNLTPELARQHVEGWVGNGVS
jgi:bidirectional [NiFe] hydrogenase diaphorase subunit